MTEQPMDNRDVVWCWVKKLPCQVTCQMWDLAAKRCKMVLACERVLKARILE